MRLLDLFCGAGGAGVGYHRAGFEVVGVDINPQPRYPFEFIQADALHFAAEHWQEFDAIHASPPCQSYTPLGALHPDKTYPDLVGATRGLLDLAGLPYIIENVMAAPLIKDRSITLCGGMFGLRTYRHRRFESKLSLVAPEHPKHIIRTATKQRRTLWDQGWHVSITGDVGTYVGPEAMGIDWMSGNELCEAIPPAYTAWIGEQLAAAVSEGGGVSHPEDFCDRCGGRNVKPWYAPSPLWNAVMRGGSINGEDDPGGIVCMTCFVDLAVERGVVTDGSWRLDVTEVAVPLEMTTPSGRVWDAEQWLWVEPPIVSEVTS